MSEPYLSETAFKYKKSVADFVYGTYSIHKAPILGILQSLICNLHHYTNDTRHFISTYGKK